MSRNNSDKTERAQIHFFSEVFAVIASLDLKVRNISHGEDITKVLEIREYAEANCQKWKEKERRGKEIYEKNTNQQRIQSFDNKNNAINSNINTNIFRRSYEPRIRDGLTTVPLRTKSFKRSYKVSCISSIVWFSTL